MTQEEQKVYDRQNCDICSNRFECSKVKDYDKGKDVSLHNCNNFDDVFAK